MNKQALSLAVFIAGAYPAASHALGLGDIESSSHLNQPLRAKIELLAAAPADASKIQVRLASPDVFNRVGVARPDFLGSLNFTPTIQGGKPVILVTSDSPMQEPFVNFLLEVSWPQGQLLKEYTVMLDPPVMLQPGNTVAGGEASVRAEPKAVGTVRRQQQAQSAVSTAAQPQAAPAPAPVNSGRNTYHVKSGDTLFRVASRLQRPGVSNEQMMMALFRANPGAFINRNINNLRAGVTLKAPSSADVSKVSRAEARRHIRQQNAEWREFRQSLAKSTVPQKTSGVATTSKSAQVDQAQANKTQAQARLEVLGAKDGKGESSNATVAAGNAKLSEMEQQLALARESLATRQKENEELKSRVGDLESMLDKKNRLIDLRNEQLASLQKQLSDNGIKTNPLADVGQVANDANAVVEPQTPAPTQNETDQGKDLQAHLANIAGKDGDAVLRGEQPSTSVTPPANVPSSPPQPEMPAALTPPPLTPPVANIAPPDVIPIVPPPSDEVAQSSPPPVFADQQDGEGLLALLTSPLAMQLGAGALALLLLLWLLGRRRKSGTSDDAGEGDKRSKKTALKVGMDPPVDQVLGDDFGVVGVAGVDVSGKRFVADVDTDTAADLLDVNQDSPWGDAFEPIKADVKDSYSETNHTLSDESHEEDDLLTEANVYIAYGLYQQAESELKKGIERHPERLEYRHKLLECYFVANNRDAFDRQAEQFVTLEGYNKEALWKGIIEWGRKISPDNVLYQNANSLGDGASVASGVGSVAAAALATAAFAEPASAQRNTIADNLKSDEELFFGEAQTSEIKPAPEPDFADEALPSTETAPNDLDDLDLGELDFDDIDLDKLLQGDERPVASQVVAGMPTSVDVVGQVDDDDLALPDLDLDLDFDQPLNLESEAENSAESLSKASDSDNLLDFLTDGLDEPDGAGAGAGAGAGVSSVVPASAASTTSATSLNLHLDNSSLNRILPKDTFYAPPAETDTAAGQGEDWLGDIDDALSFLDFPDDEIDLHEAHISTKLDLARAYLDMGDIEGARSTLEEVMVEGNDDQRREAEVLLHQTG
ncbi:FimV/HubP family polar landmark protein [Candidatus Thiothrix anitrata]|uniref:LysM domain-containing protein n=1 Tax=Candidatus Thiothrix anitrata TaxID=2823902 RepID=A0ABX7X238_9GAMM|nr:FimV/HubP family polar landmark protein [Candidatus Thiothrix anitrata]QTR49960.1 hypothetical protein J8380_17345 [Candidatus Thiothrix anitrata]